MNYSTAELVDMIYAIGESGGNCLLASRLYAQKFPGRRQPEDRSLQKLKDRFERTGNVAYEKTPREKSTLNEENQMAIALAVVEDPELSVREISRALEIKKSSVNKCIKLNKFHPYRSQLHQELVEEDFARRINFCHWAHNKLTTNEDFFKYVLFTDEATFHRSGFTNRHNFHYYDTQNPHVVLVQNYQHKWSVNVWGGIVNDYVIGPHFFEGHLTGAAFLDFLRNEFPRLIEHVPDFIKNQMWLQLDGAPPHYSREVRQWIDQQFPERWIGRGGPVTWPPRSPDLTCMDFFLWGMVKCDVYRRSPTTLGDMKERIRQAFGRITPDMLGKVRQSFNNRLDLCLLKNGGHFEQ